MRIEIDSERPRDRGFTLIELMIVVVIIGILAGLAIPRFAGAASATRQHEAHLILKQVHTLQGGYYERHSSYAGNLADLAPLGWSDPNLKFYSLPAITLNAFGYTVCMVADNAADGNRSIDQNGTLSTC